MRKDTDNRTVFLIFTNLVLFLALAIAVFCLLQVNDQPETQTAEESAFHYQIDEEALIRYAAHYGVSQEYLQLVLPGMLVYQDGAEYVFQEIDNHVPLHDYDWELLSYADGRTYYTDPDYPDVRYGIDVSEYQGEIDWQAVAADGIRFAFIRIGYRGYESGKLVADARSAENLAGAAAAGLDIGVYFFSQAITVEEAQEEADMVLAAIDGYSLTCPVVFDMEEIYQQQARTDILDREETTKIARAFCRQIERAGLQAMIYGNTKWLARRLDLAELTDYPLWFAQYYDKPLFPYDFCLWQYSNSGSVAGIETTVDLNIQFRPF